MIALVPMLKNVLRYCDRHTSVLQEKKENTVKKSRIWKSMVLVGSQALLLASGGSCLPDNIFADTAGQIVNGLILAGFNIIASGSGIQI